MHTNSVAHSLKLVCYLCILKTETFAQPQCNLNESLSHIKGIVWLTLFSDVMQQFLIVKDIAY